MAKTGAGPIGKQKELRIMKAAKDCHNSQFYFIRQYENTSY